MEPREADTRDGQWVVFLFACTSLISLVHYYRSGAILLSGDALAHINIARRVFDSLNPGPQQLGTVWLPLPHLVILPFVVTGWMWQTGVGGSIPSMLTYVAACWGLFRTLRLIASRQTAWLGVLIFGLNPNLLFVQSTALNEPLYLAAFVWSIYWLLRLEASMKSRNLWQWRRSLRNLALWLSAAMLTRYDGWVLAPIAALLTAAIVSQHISEFTQEDRHDIRNSTLAFLVFLLLTPVVWLAYNYGIYGNALEFANGPYSARAIAQRSQGSQHYPGYHDVSTALHYVLKAGELNMAEGLWQRVLLVISLLGSVLALLRGHGRMVLLLWLPLLFYSYSVAYQDVPMFVPVWWPFSYYNLRYGLQLLPLFAVFTALTSSILSRAGKMRAALFFVVGGLVAISYYSVWRAAPVCLREVRANGEAEAEFESRLAQRLRELPGNSRLLMEVGNHVGALERAGIPLRQVLNETNGLLWQEALAAPVSRTDYLVAVDHDEAAKSAAQNQRLLTEVGRVTTAAYQAVIYRVQRP